MVLSPIIPSAEAGRLNHRGLAGTSRTICPSNLCLLHTSTFEGPAGNKCCASPIQTQSTTGSP
uniref:Uncharacterized protein n=1 Tax=Populus trichocarpa TaxID=3694 RepID=A0A3N7FI14_POPTR